jgi:starch phosphorylase
MPEALEKWPVALLGRVLPRHLQLIYEINHRFLQKVQAAFPGDDDDDRCARMSIIEEGPEQRVRMAHLAIVGSHSVNGVAALHTEILKTHIFKDFVDLWPERFNNKTNGVTQRRWLLKANPRLSSVITEHIGDAWITDLTKLRALSPLSSDPSLQAQWQAVKRANKERLATEIVAQYERRGVALHINLDSMFDCHVKRIHEYKRQLLNVLHAATLYLRIKDNPQGTFTPRTILFSGKAAPGYLTAKLIIRLINAVGSAVNSDLDVGDRLKVVFLSDYRVSLAEKIFPASDLSEQISTAGTEASGTGNMKFALNGALTIGTMDGANVEICEEVGADNMFIFGLRADEVRRLKPTCEPWTFVTGNDELRRVLAFIASGALSPEDPSLFRGLVDQLLTRDEYLLLADYADYIACQDRVSQAYLDGPTWTKKSIENVARIGTFSSDRTIQHYATDIWDVHPVRR